MYNFLEFIGSLGGLAVALNLIGGGIMFFISLLTASPIESHILKNVYKRDPNLKETAQEV